MTTIDQDIEELRIHTSQTQSKLKELKDLISDIGKNLEIIKQTLNTIETQLQPQPWDGSATESPGQTNI